MRTINYKVSYEKLVSRIPGMFAFLDTDGRIVKATDGVQGNYGKVVADIKMEINGYGGFNHTCTDGTALKVSNGSVHSYRTLIDTFYKAVGDKNWERNEDGTYKEPFLRFMERGIGLRYVGLSEEKTGKKKCGVEVVNRYPLAPDFIYIGEAKSLYDKMTKMKKQIDFFKKHTEYCKEDLRSYHTMEEEYRLKNGDNLILVLERLIDESERVAEEYLGYAKNGPKLNFCVNLTTTEKDLGMVTKCTEEWVPGKRYYNGDTVYYVDENGYGLVYDACFPEEYETKDEYGRKYTEGKYNEDTEIIEFDKLNWAPQYLVKAENVVGVKGTCNSHLQMFRRFETYVNRYGEAETPENYSDWLWYYRTNRPINREERYDELGNLTVMRREGKKEWVEAIQGTNLKLKKVEGKYEALNLACWGDVITYINATNDKESGIGKITFTYWLGAHLKAEFTGKSEDDDGNVRYYFDNFTADAGKYASDYGKNHGVKYTETYIYYKGSELWDLVESDELENYANGNYDKESKTVDSDDKYKIYEKMEFDTSYNLYPYEIKIGNRFNRVPFIKADFETKYDISRVEVEDTPLIRYDYYNGVNFQPYVSDDVNIERGVTQAMEKHIKLGEIKTMEDLENYSNGGFFMISKENVDLG